ncbi:MAG TPA: DUF2795 domain-containing protein [Yinghuangia sp.]|uniref:DUF2795 domain-containing protein n=1 Tax=Yinghuangia sp. YIM S10712 TaxID=3436930 RepID=UPI002C84DDEB|nr:DUF2795 domain-containing protein [Yinghuangia sp.]
MTPRHETDRGDGARAAGGRTAAGLTPRDVHLRTELAHHLRADVFPADRGRILDHLRGDAAHNDVMDLARSLPDDDRRYANVQELAAELGLGTGHGHT